MIKIDPRVVGRCLVLAAGTWCVAGVQAQSTPDVNVAAAANGATAFADSELSGSSFDRDGVAPASRLIDGIIGNEPGSNLINRWHSATSRPHPHWACIRFAGPARIHKVVLWRADIGSPVDVEGQWSPDHGRTVHPLFVRKGLALTAKNPSVEIEFPPVISDNFRLYITRSSNPDFPNYTQLSELQVFGTWAGPPRPPAPKPIRAVGSMIDAPLPKGLSCSQTADGIEFTSRRLKVVFPKTRPGISFLSVDADGTGHLERNFLKGPRGVDVGFSGWDLPSTSADASFVLSRRGNVVRYSGIGVEGAPLEDLTFKVGTDRLQVAIDFHGSGVAEGSPLRALFDVASVVATPLGRVRVKGELLFPVLLHFADHGSLLVRESGGATWKFAGNRGAGEIELSLTPSPDSRSRRQALDMQVIQAYPERAIVDADPKLVGVKNAWLNIFGYRPDIACLSNNVVSDNCMFCMYEYADHALYTPPLFDDFTALDLVGTSLDSYFDGLFGYGGERDVMLDTDPSMVISSWDYAVGKHDMAWLQRRIGNIEIYADHIIASDKDGDGLSEAKRTGNSGSGIDGAGEWSSNWWDVVSFGWKDAYCNALDYRAFRCIADLESRLGRHSKAELYAGRAALIKSRFYTTFFNPATGILAGWRSKDGQLHDYYFTFVNAIAVCYDLVTPAQANAIMDRILAKMREVGYTNFKIGLPGNLIPVARKDYAGGGVLGQPHKDDGSDSFQDYENGGATGGFAYFTIQALYKLGRKADAERILGAMLEGYRDHVFENGVGSGVDWKRWDGRPCGYEGLLTDSFYALDALITGKLGKGVPIP